MADDPASEGRPAFFGDHASSLDRDDRHIRGSRINVEGRERRTASKEAVGTGKGASASSRTELTEAKMNYLLYPFVLAVGMFVAILSATSATL